MKIIKNKLFPFGSFNAINLLGIIISKGVLSHTQKNHEFIHTLQQREMLFVGFYVWYVMEWLIRLAYYRNIKKAYFNISLEREAYAHQHDILYAGQRRLWAWMHYLRQRPSHTSSC